MQTRREVSESYWAAECESSIDRVLEHYRADATYEGPGGFNRGHAEIRAAYEESFRTFPKLAVTIVGEVPCDYRSAIEFEGTLTDTKGKQFRVPGVNVVEVRDGRLVSVRSYEDSRRFEMGEFSIQWN